MFTTFNYFDYWLTTFGHYLNIPPITFISTAFSLLLSYPLFACQSVFMHSRSKTICTCLTTECVSSPNLVTLYYFTPSRAREMYQQADISDWYWLITDISVSVNILSMSGNIYTSRFWKTKSLLNCKKSCLHYRYFCKKKKKKKKKSTLYIFFFFFSLISVSVPKNEIWSGSISLCCWSLFWVTSSPGW